MDTSSVTSDDLSDYDVISNPSQRSLESSIADLMVGQTSYQTYEPPALLASQEKFITSTLSAEDVQEYVRRALNHSSPSSKSKPTGYHFVEKIIRVYVDGVYDIFTLGHTLQLRQAKLSFPSVHLTVGVFSDSLCELHGTPASVSHAERCEVLRHCRWVDEVIPDAPWQVGDPFLRQRRFDYVAIEEGTSVDPRCDKFRLNGYDNIKKLGKVIPTRRLVGVQSARGRVPAPPSTPTPPLIFDDCPLDVASNVDTFTVGF